MGDIIECCDRTGWLARFVQRGAWSGPMRSVIVEPKDAVVPATRDYHGKYSAARQQKGGL